MRDFFQDPETAALIRKLNDKKQEAVQRKSLKTLLHFSQRKSLCFQRKSVGYSSFHSIMPCLDVRSFCSETAFACGNSRHYATTPLVSPSSETR